MLFFLLPILVTAAVVLWLLKKGRDERSAFSSVHRTIEALPIADAKQEALARLTDQRDFVVIESRVGPTRVFEQLAPELREFFQRFESVSSTGSGFRLSRADLRPSTRDRTLLRIGEEFGGGELETEIAVRPGDETIFEIESDGSIDVNGGQHRTVYHLIVQHASERRRQ